MKNSQGSKPRSKLGLQAKIQIVVHSFMLVLFTFATLVLSHSIKNIILANVQQRAEGIANEVIDGANMLMETGEISVPENRKLLIKKIASSGNIIGLRLVRTEQVIRQFGEGLPEERIKDAVEKTAIDSKKPSYQLEYRDGIPVFRAVTPYLVSHDFHGTDCLNCHNVEVGSVNGASDIDIDLTADFEKLQRIILWLVIGQIMMQLMLFLLIRWVMRKFVIRPLDEAIGIANRIAEGDLTEMIATRSGDETGQLIQALKNMNESLGSIVTEVRNGTEMISIASGQIASGNADLSHRTEDQAANLEETASSMEALLSAVRKNTENARHAYQLAQGSCDVAEQSGVAMNNLVATMTAINESSKRIGDIISVMDGIAFQTNILALNAAVEAARAGEHGRGFAVVAAEVRNLAQRSAAAAKEIKLLIGGSMKNVSAGSTQVNEAAETISDVVTSVQLLASLIKDISTKTSEQNESIEQVNTTVVKIDEATQQNAALVEEASAAAESMLEQANNLYKAVNAFKLIDEQRKASREVARIRTDKDPDSVIPLLGKVTRH